MERAVDKPIAIDLAAVLRERLPGVMRFVPRMIVRRLEKLICQDDLNYLLSHNHGRRDADFCEGVMSDLDVKVDVRGSLPDPAHKKVILVCNHPLGALDGIAIIDTLTKIYNSPVHFIVNDLLMAVEPLSGVFVPVNKNGRQSRSATDGVDAAMAGDRPVVIFPAGLCSRRDTDGVVRDREWKKTFVVKARKYGRDIVPMHFLGQNSDSFYRFAARRERLGIKFNIEMVLLPREVFRARGSRFTLTFGDPISCDKLDGAPADVAQRIKKTVYSLTSQQ